MEIFVHNVPKHVSERDVIKSLASILHSRDFEQYNPSGGQLNFHLFLFKERNRPSSHRGIGALTLGSIEIATRFLSIYGGNFPLVSWVVTLSSGARAAGIKFAMSKKSAKPEIVKMIKETPYIDPALAKERDELAEQLRGELKVDNVQLGWRCRDDSFSIEWDAHAEIAQESEQPNTEPVSLDHGKIIFDLESRELRVFLPIKRDDSGIASLLSKRNVICIRFSRVESFTVERSSSANAILLTLSYPPAFESHPSAMMEAMMETVLGPASRTRLHAFSDSHARVSPFTSLALRILVNSLTGIQEFKNKAGLVHLPRPYEIFTGPVNHQLFAPSVLDAVNQWAEGLDWVVAFQVVALLNDLVVDPTELWNLRARVDSLVVECGVAKTAEILRLFCGRLKTLMWAGSDDGVTTIEGCLDLAKEDATDAHMHIRNHEYDDGYFNCHHCTVTPTRMILEGPFPDQTNRVLRRYRENNHYFMRVNFVDEEHLSFRWDRGVDGASFVKFRVGGTLRNGIDIAGRHFDFLAYSSSALREHAVWFCTPFEQDGVQVTAQSIRESLGSFKKSILCAARYGARLSQAFTATEASVTLEAEEFDMIPDIISDSGSTFTDGIGQLSPKLNRAIIKAIQSRPGNRKKFYCEPSAWQVRIGGYKGMIACNYKLQDMECYLRPSMDKFDAHGNYDIEIAGTFNKPLPMFLNRYLVMILETLGVPAKVFIDLQDAAVEEIQDATESIVKCARLFELNGVGTAYRVTSVLLSLKNKLNIDFVNQEAKYILQDSFVDRAVEFATNHILRVMKHKARIPLKGSYTLVGIIDEHKYLEPDQVFVCVRDKDEKPKYLSGRILITRSPQVHPGDVQFVNAIGRPPADSPFKHEEFPNCVVFSSRGERSIPSMLAGGDLDGDIYNVITDKNLFPRACDTPGGYPPVELKKLDHPCEIEDLADWVADYINADILGFVADRFLIVADQSEHMCRDPACLKLAQLASSAVDFVKSGTPVDPKNLPPPLLPYHVKPDWSVGEVGMPRSNLIVYESKRAIGQLYRRINLSDTERTAGREAKRQHRLEGRGKKADDGGLTKAMGKLRVGNDETLFPQDEDPISTALRSLLRPRIDVDSTVPGTTSAFIQDHFTAYVAELRTICGNYTLTRSPLTEEEVLMGTITAKTSQPRRRKDLMSRMRTQSGDLVKKIRIELAGGMEKEASEEDLEEWLVRAWVAWKVSALQAKAKDETAKFGAKTFGWIALSSIFECIRILEERERMAYIRDL